MSEAITPYEALGGEPMVRVLVARFYALMDSLPEARACRDVHPPSLAHAEETLLAIIKDQLVVEPGPDSSRYQTARDVHASLYPSLRAAMHQLAGA